MSRLSRRIAGYALAALILTLAVAIPVFAAAYTATFTVVESLGNSYTKLPVFGVINNKYLASSGYTLPNARDVRIETGGGLVLLRMVADDRILTVTDVPASSNTNLFYTSNNTPADFSIITGYGGNITIADAASLEPGANFEIDATGYLDTTSGVNRFVVAKASALSLAVDPLVTGKVDGTVAGSTSTATMAPSGAGDLTDLTVLVGAATHWQAVLTNDGDASYVQSAGGTSQEDTYTITSTVPATASINSVTIHAVAESVVGAQTLKTVARLAGVDTLSGVHNLTGAYVDYGDSLARPGGGSWTVADIAVLQIGVLSGNTAVNAARVTQVYVVVSYTMPDSVVSLYGVSSGVYASVFSGNSTQLGLTIGAASNTTTQYNSVVDAVTDWFALGDATPYLTSFAIKVGVGLTEIVRFAPNDIVRGVAYSTGTAAFTNGLTAVTGTATSWDSTMDGAAIKYNADNVWSVIQSVTSNTTLTLASAYIGGGGGAAAYTIAPRLPDLDTATSEEGAITWGTNPAGVTVAIGGLVESGLAAGTVSMATPTPDTLPPNEQSNWYLDPDVSGTLASNPFHPIVAALSNTGGLTTFTEIQVWRFFAMMATLLLMAGGAKVVPGHVGVVGFAQLIGIGGSVAMTIFPLWAVVIAVGLFVATLVLERAPWI